MTMTQDYQDELDKFQGLLRYFILHLEYWNYYNKNEKKGDGYNWPPIIGDDYKNLITKGKKAGQGYEGDKIQDQISKWSTYSIGEINISVQSQFDHGYTTTASYLHWNGTGLNINAEWNEAKEQIVSLYFRDVDGRNVGYVHASREVIFADTPEGIKPLYKKYFDAKRNALEYKKDWLVNLLNNNHNLILTGAPGTGKTYLAHQIAALMIGCKEEELKTSKQFGFVQFHPSYDYTDFVEGLRPVKKKNSNEIFFERKDGIFIDFCRKALYDYNEKKGDAPKYVFLIDEINRGEISKIFGELFFSIDDGYRGVNGAISTQYSNLWTKDDLFNGGKEFYVPENVYIIGTMNDIDRSVESMDFAFRRRFSFVELTASESESMIYSQPEWKGWDDAKKQEAVNRMRKLNEAIVSNGGLTEQYQIGGAYFLKLGKNNFNFEKLWKENIYGVLFEYYRGNPDAREIVDKLEEAYYLK